MKWLSRCGQTDDDDDENSASSKNLFLVSCVGWCFCVKAQRARRPSKNEVTFFARRVDE